jgi:hypothetical protein
MKHFLPFLTSGALWREAMAPFLWALRSSGKNELADEYLSEMDRIFSDA